MHRRIDEQEEIIERLQARQGSYYPEHRGATSGGHEERSSFQKYTLQTPYHETSSYHRTPTSHYSQDHLEERVAPRTSFDGSKYSPKNYPLPEHSGGYKRLKNKRHIDRLYNNGKLPSQHLGRERQLARSKSALMTSHEAKEFRECTFQPKIKHQYDRILDQYHEDDHMLVSRLSEAPKREKARLNKYKREAEEQK